MGGLLLVVAGVVLALAFGTFAEYIFHWCLHNINMGVASRIHHKHHTDNDTKHWLKECLLYYCPVAIPPSLFFLLINWNFGVGWLLGGILYVMVFTAAHIIQHDYHKAVWWMRYPIHYWHHKHYRGTANYGVTTDIWDKIFGTYKECK